MSDKPGLYTGADVFIGDHPLNTIDAENVAWVITDLDGWWGLPDVEVPDDPRPSTQDGSYYTMGRFNSRSINIKGHILPIDGRAPSAVAARNAFNRLLVLVRTRTELKVREDGVMKVSLVQLSSKPLIKINQATGLAEFDIALKATDPLKYSDGATYSSIGIESGSTGRTYKRMFNFSYGGAQQGNEVTVINRGSYESMPELYIQGPVTNPAIHNLGSGQTLAFDLTLGPLDGLSIKPLTKQITMNGENRRNALLPYSRWFPIYPGNNYLKFTGTQQIPTQERISVSTNEAENPVPMADPANNNILVATNLHANPRPTNNMTSWSNGSGTNEVAGNISQMATGDTPTGVVFDTNYASNPRAVTGSFTSWGYQAGTGETTVVSFDNSSTNTPNNFLGFVRRTVTAAKTGNTSGIYYREASTAISGVAGDVRTGSLWVRYSHTVDVNMSLQMRAGSTVVTTGASGVTTIPANTWVRLSVTLTATAAYDTFQIWPNIMATSVLPVGGWNDATQAMFNDTTDLIDFFDGGIGNWGDSRYATLYIHQWLGTANASASTRSLGIADWDRGPTGLKGLVRHGVARVRTASSVGWGTISNAASGVAGDTVNGTMYLRPSVDTNLRLRVQFRSGSTVVGTSDTPLTFLPANQWTKVENSALSTGAYDNVYMWAYQTYSVDQLIPSRGFIDASCAQFTIGANPTDFFDGGTPNTRNFVTAWTGTALLSTSTMTQTNRGWDADATMYSLTGDTAMVRRPSTRSIKCVRKNTRPTNNLVADCERIGANTYTTQATYAWQDYVNGGSVWVRTTHPGAWAYVQLNYFQANGASAGPSKTSERIDLAQNQWERLVFADDSQPPANTTAMSMRVRVYSDAVDGTQIGAQTWFQDAKIGFGSVAAEPYFDGSFVYARWGGAANNSPSYVDQVVPQVYPPKLTILSRDAWIE